MHPVKQFQSVAQVQGRSSYTEMVEELSQDTTIVMHACA